MDIKIPQSIKVGGFTYTIKLDKNNRVLRSENRYGQCSYTDREILVETEFSRDQTNQTFLHEILHSVDSVYNNTALCDEVVDRLSNGLHQIFDQLGVNFIQDEVK